MRARLLRYALAATLAASIHSMPVEAASCATLAKQLASAQKTRASQGRKAQSLIARQRIELQKTRALQKRAGCVRRSSPTCDRLASTIAAMEKRIDGLNASTSRNRGSAIKARMKAKGCGKPRKRREAKSKPIERREVTVATAQPVPARRVTTICVRTCDGYFFPVSSNTAAERARADGARCAAMCPSADTRLFTKPANAPITAMVDAWGMPYTSRPYAFRHQAPDYEHTKQCTCGTATQPLGAVSLRGPQDGTNVEPEAEASALDRETRRNETVSFGWERARAFARPKRPRGSVRVVGQAFVPDR